MNKILVIPESNKNSINPQDKYFIDTLNGIHVCSN